MATKFVDTHPQFTVYVNGSFAPAADGEIEFFNVGTTGAANRRDTYNVPSPSDPVDPSEINPNPVPLDGYGRSTVPIFLVGTYNTVIRDSEGNQLDTVDNVEGSGVQGVASLIVTNVAALAELDTDVYTSCYVLCTTTLGDGGQGWFYFDSNSAVSDNGVSIIEPDLGGGRWYLQNNAHDSITVLSAAGTSDAITITTAPPTTAFDAKRVFYVQNTQGANTLTNPTLTINGLAAKTIKRDNSTALAVGDCGLAGYIMQLKLIADSSAVILLNPKTPPVDNSTIEVSSAAIRVKAAGITNNEMAANSIAQTNMQDNSVGYDEMRNDAIHQNELYTGTSTSTFTVDFFGGQTQIDDQTDSGGQYSFWFYSEITAVNGVNGSSMFWFSAGARESTSHASKDTRIALCGLDLTTSGATPIDADGATTNRFVDASPPYDLGHGNIPLFISLRINKDGKITGTQCSTAPVWAHNGKTCITPDRHSKVLNPVTGKRIGTRKYKTVINPESEIIIPPWEGGDIKKWNLEKYLHPEMVEIEIDTAFKNKDMNDIPHPFISRKEGDRVVMIEPTCSLVDELAIIHNKGVSIGKLFQEGWLELVDKIDVYNSPIGVEVYSARWKNSI